MSNYTDWVNFYEFSNIPINFIVLLWSKIYKEKVDNEMSNEDGYKNWYNFSSIHSAERVFVTAQVSSLSVNISKIIHASPFCGRVWNRLYDYIYNI